MRVPAALVALCLSPALALCQSLGDAARREADERAGRPLASAKAYTDADLRSEETGTTAVDAQDAPAARSATPDGGPAASPSPAGHPATDELRARLDREAEQRKRQELLWRNRALQARARVDAAKREHGAVCGPGVLLLTGG